VKSADIDRFVTFLPWRRAPVELDHLGRVVAAPGSALVARHAASPGNVIPAAVPIANWATAPAGAAGV